MSTRAQGERALDMLGATNNELLELLGSMVGLTIGEKEANIFYIQDSGQKKVGRCYIDNTNMKLYRCIAATTSTSNTTANFTEINLLNHSDRLDNLKRKSSVTTIPITSGKNYILLNQYYRNKSGLALISISKHSGSVIRYGGAIVLFGIPQYSWEGDLLVEAFSKSSGLDSSSFTFVLGNTIGSGYESTKLYLCVESSNADSIQLEVF